MMPAQVYVALGESGERKVWVAGVYETKAEAQAAIESAAVKAMAGEDNAMIDYRDLLIRYIAQIEEAKDSKPSLPKG